MTPISLHAGEKTIFCHGNAGHKGDLAAKRRRLIEEEGVLAPAFALNKPSSSSPLRGRFQRCHLIRLFFFEPPSPTSSLPLFFRGMTPRNSGSPAGTRRPLGRCPVASHRGRAAIMPCPPRARLSVMARRVSAIFFVLFSLFSEVSATFDSTPPFSFLFSYSLNRHFF